MQNLPNLSFKSIVLNTPALGQRRLDWDRMGAQGVKDNMTTFENQLFKTVQDTAYLRVPSLTGALHHLLCEDSFTGIPSFPLTTQECDLVCTLHYCFSS